MKRVCVVYKRGCHQGHLARCMYEKSTDGSSTQQLQTRGAILRSGMRKGQRRGAPGTQRSVLGAK